MKPQTKKLISFFTLLAILLLFICYISKNIPAFKQLFSIATNFRNLPLLFYFAIILLFSFFLNGYLLNILIYSFGLCLKIKEWFGLAIITNFYNYITPFHGGMVARAFYLKNRHAFPYVNFLATLSAIYLIIFLVGSVAGLASLFFIWLNYGLFNQLIFILFFAIFLFTSLIIIFSPKLPESRNRWFNRFIKVINGWHLIKNNKKIILATVLISLTQVILGAINMIILYSVFNIELSFFKALFIASINSIAILISITPGNLGVGDAINVFSATIIGVRLPEAVAATVLGRAINLLIIFILGPIFSYFLLNPIRNKISNGAGHKNEKTEGNNFK